MTPQEANKIIAEFMGFEFYKGLLLLRNESGLVVFETIANYTSSLDALVPVWEKLGVELWRDGDSYTCRVSRFNQGYDIHHGAETISEAAAIATAKVIKELQK